MDHVGVSVSIERYGDSDSEGSEPVGEDESIEMTTEDESSYYMVTQLDWESDIIWDGSDVKYRKYRSKAMVMKWPWIRSGISIEGQNVGHPGGQGSGFQSVGRGSLSLGVGSSDSVLIPFFSGTQQKGRTGSKNKNVSVAKADGPWYSMFPVENPQLVHYTWEDDVIFDADNVREARQPQPCVVYPKDEDIILCAPDDVDPNASVNTLTSGKTKILHPHVKKGKILLGKAGVINVLEEDSPPPRNDGDKDPYNISNDEFYESKYPEESLVTLPSCTVIQHSTPVVELRAPFIPTHMSQAKLRTFHRPPLRRYKSGPLSNPSPYPVLPLTRHIAKKAKEREQERLASGGGDTFFLRTLEDLSGKDGELVLVEYSEQHPPLLSQVGMCSKFKNYYKRNVGKDSGPPKCRWGETVFAHTSPFLGIMYPGQIISTIENNMYRSPIYEHPTPTSNFIIIRTGMNYFIREYERLYTAGQQSPFYEVPPPHSKRTNNFVRDFLQVFIYRLFCKSRDSPRRVLLEDVKLSFPTFTESVIRKRLHFCADYKRTGVHAGWWIIKPEFRLPTEEEIRAMVSPEQCCAYFSQIATSQRFLDTGYGGKFPFVSEDDNQGKMDDEIKTAPWNTTRAYLLAVKNKGHLQVRGPADPTGCGEGFSYIRVPNKPQVTKEEQEAAQPRRIVTGTDADLRRLSLNKAKAILQKVGIPESEMKNLSRWEIIDIVRTISTEKAKRAKTGETGMTEFSRGNRFSVAEHQERYKEQCQQIFEIQNRVLGNSELLTTDESSEEDGECDMEEHGRTVEKMLDSQESSSDLIPEKEEQVRRELLTMLMGVGKADKDDKTPKERASNMRHREKADYVNSSLSNQPPAPGRVLKIHRTFTDDDGKEFTRTEIVREPSIVDIYMRIRRTKQEPWIRKFASLDDPAKNEMKVAKRRVQEKLRRIKRNQERQTQVPGVVKKTVKRVKPDLKMTCGSCGQVGHMRTNKDCPLYQNTAVSLPTFNVGVTKEQGKEVEKPLNPEDEVLVKVEGTKVKFSTKLLLKYSEEMKQPTEVMKPVLVKQNKRVAPAPHCDYLSKKKSKVNRQRVDPKVVISGIFEDILKKLTLVPDSNHFHFPVGSRIRNYHHMIRKPMDLQTMRVQAREHKYQARSQFLKDVQLIMDNCAEYNGSNHLLTVYAERVVEHAKLLIRDNEERLRRLELMINPLLHDDGRIGLSYILGSATNKLRSMQEAFPFLKPVNKKRVKDYYDIIKFPMDLETIMIKVKGNEYRSRMEYLADIQLLHSNSLQYNGADNDYTKNAKAVVDTARAYFEQFKEYLAELEKNILAARVKAGPLDDEYSDVTGIVDFNTPPPSFDVEDTENIGCASHPPRQGRCVDFHDDGDDDEETFGAEEEDKDKGGSLVAENEVFKITVKSQKVDTSSGFDPDISTGPRMKRMRTDS